MIFCSNCFKDNEIKQIIDKGSLIGNCPICGSKGVHLYNTKENVSLIPLFESLITAYTLEKSLPPDYPKEELNTLSECMRKDWNIFSDIPLYSIEQILKEVDASLYSDYPELFEKKVGIAEKNDPIYLEKNSILHMAEWNDFVNQIKCRNRFHSNLINLKLLEQFCKKISYTIVPGNKKFYRGRIAQNSIGYTSKEMGAPPPEYATDGRANSKGISRLYLTDDKDTALHEIRASEYDFVSIGTFKLLRKIHIVDLSMIDQISPFGEEIILPVLAVNRDNLHKINLEMGRPMRRNDSPLDYLPTQYICDFIMSLVDSNGDPLYDGIKFDSVMHKGGSNYTIFYPEAFTCVYTKTYEVKELDYYYDSV